VTADTEMTTPIDAIKFPPEAYRIMFFHTSNHSSWHSHNRNNVGQLIDYVDMLVNVVKQLDEDYVKALNEFQKGADSH
jgi:hypothetical protein